MSAKLKSTIEAFCQVGFFDNEGIEISTLIEKIIAASKSCYFGNISDLENEPLFEQMLLAYDKEICWFIEDANAYYLSDEVSPEMYVDVFKQLSLISKGLFTPEDLVAKECGYCEGRDKRILIYYTLNGEKTELVFCADGWALMLNFLEEVNESIEHTAHSFEFISDPYGPCFIFFVSTSQK